MQHNHSAELFGQRGPHPLVADLIAGTKDATDLRCCAIRSTLCWELQANGHVVEMNKAIVDGETIQYWVYRNEPPVGQPRPQIEFEVEAFGGGRRLWTDKPRKPLEAFIPNIVRRFEAIARGRVIDRQRHAEWEREHEAAQRKAALRYYKELERGAQEKTLHRLARDWRQSTRLTEFLDALECQLEGSQPDPAMSDWLRWAREHTAQLNPFSPNSLQRLRCHAAAVAYHPIDDEEPDPYEMDWREFDELDHYVRELYDRHD